MKRRGFFKLLGMAIIGAFVRPRLAVTPKVSPAPQWATTIHPFGPPLPDLRHAAFVMREIRLSPDQYLQILTNPAVVASLQEQGMVFSQDALEKFFQRIYQQGEILC